MSNFRSVLLLALCLLGGCDVVDRPYYKLSALGGTVTRESPSLSQLGIPIGEEIQLSVSVLCYALAPQRDFSAGDPCEIGVYATASPADDVQFTSVGFTAEVIDPPGSEIVAQGRIPDFLDVPSLRFGRATTFVDLNFDDVPQRFLLHLPVLSINGTVYELPAVTFTYEENIDIDFLFSM